jgi:putative ABC transport system substrate-binding protein
MRRRNFLSVLGSAALAWPLVARAQRPTVPLIGFLMPGSARPSSAGVAAFQRGLADVGQIDNRNYTVAFHYADGDLARLPGLAEELIRQRPDVIVAGSTAAALAARRTTADIPIVCVTCTDPVSVGLAASEARPGGNVTGLLTRVDGMAGKLIELAREVVPTLGRIGVLSNATNPTNSAQRHEIETAAAGLPITIVPAEAALPGELHGAFQAMTRENVAIVVVLQDSTFLNERKRIVLLAAAARLPSLFVFREFVEDGGLISYGIDVNDNFRRTAYFVGRIFKGEKPSSLPFEFPTKLTLAINLGTAKALGLDVPPQLLARADEVIE